MTEDVFEIVGTVVGGAFNVEAVHAEGGFAVVYRAYHGAFHAPVALKCLKVPTVARTSQREFLERFREEGELLFRLSQSIPAVVRPLHVDAFETPKGVFVPYMALEWLDGETLDVIIARRAQEGRPPMAIKPVIRLLSPVARALARAHKFPGPKGPVSIVHRDLKPDNIIVATINGEEVVKILDFGIAKVKSVASQTAGRQSQEGGAAAVPFTPGYAAPEQWFPKRFGQTGPWTDVWGLALTTVESLSGKAAIDGDHAAMMGTAIDDKRRPSPRSEGVKISDEVEEVFLKALAVDPRDRFQDVGEFWDKLEAAVGMQRSLTPATGTTPQPHRDPRSEGAPPALEEMIEAASDAQRLSVRMPGSNGMSDAQRRRDTPAEPKPVPAVAVPHVPDLELEIELMPLAKPEPARRTDSTQKMRAVREGDAAAIAAKSEVSKSPSGQHPAMVLTAADVAPAAAAPKSATGSVEITNVPVMALSDSTGADGSSTKASGLDLAVSPEVVRRASQHKMQAITAQQLADAGLQPPGTARSQQIRAVTPAPPPAARSGQYRAANAPAPSPVAASLSSSKSGRKLGLPIALISVGLAISIAFYVNASMGGGRWSLGPVPINWVAGIFVVAGTALLLIRIFWREE
ncbi:MAG: serine/threonine protein kinase [Deltaproteobacteria bacterium]|nr:serine/threonine protein kinase [Deltaproteobacteria bacterium]